jgi:hypothetical protein
MDFKHIEGSARIPAAPLEALNHGAVMVHTPLRVLTIFFELRHVGGTAGTRTTTLIVMLGRVSHDLVPRRGRARSPSPEMIMPAHGPGASAPHNHSLQSIPTSFCVGVVRFDFTA